MNREHGMMRCRALGLFSIVMLFLVHASDCHGANRAALVIGNSAYVSVSYLPNPVRDAELVANALRNAGFAVTVSMDLNRAEFERALMVFSEQVVDADIGLVYFAGHGVQREGENYLVPVDAELRSALAVQVEAVRLDLVFDALALARTRLVILDACRDDPFASRLPAMSRGASRGLAPVDVRGNGSLIAFSTAPGQLAADGDGSHSAFAEAFARYAQQPGLEIRQVMTRVRNEVMAATDNVQTPWDNSSLMSDVFLAGPMELPDSADADGLLWEASGCATGNLAGCRVYLGRFPAGVQSVTATAALDREQHTGDARSGSFSSVELEIALAGWTASPAVRHALDGRRIEVAFGPTSSRATVAAIIARAQAAGALVSVLPLDGESAPREPGVYFPPAELRAASAIQGAMAGVLRAGLNQSDAFAVVSVALP